MPSSQYPSSPAPSLKPSLSGNRAPRSDRWKLLSYSLSNTIPYSPLFHITTIVVAFLALVIIALWAAATAGFEPYTVFDPDFNRTDDKHWYTPLLPDSVVERQKGKLCDPVIFDIGSVVQTDSWYNRLSYTIVGYNSYAKEQREEKSKSAYRGSRLDVCQVISFSFMADVRSGMVTSTAEISCKFPWPAILSTTYTLIPGVSAREPHERPTWLNGLGLDLAYRVGRLLDSPFYAKENAMGGVINGTGKWSRLSGNGYPYKGIPAASESLLLTDPVFHINAMVFSNPEEMATSEHWMTDPFSGPYPRINSDLLVPLSNFLSAFLSYIHSDLGILKNNIFLDNTTLHRLIHDTDEHIDPSIDLGKHDLFRAQTMLHPLDDNQIDPWLTHQVSSWMISANRSVATTYPCHITRSKSLASWLVSVVGLTFSIWGGLWQLYMLLVSYILSKRDDQPQPSSTTLNVTTNPNSPTLGPTATSKESIPLLPLTQVVTGNSDLTRRGTV